MGLRPQQNAQIQALTLRRIEAPPAPSASGGLLTGQHGRSGGCALRGQLLEIVVGGIDAFQHDHVCLPRAVAHKRADAFGGQRIRRGQQAVAPAGRGGDLAALAAELLDGLPDGCTGYAESPAQLLAGKLARRFL